MVSLFATQTNALSDKQLAAMMQADDAYAGSQSFFRLKQAVEDVLGKKYYLPVHQGRAAENIISYAYVKKGNLIPMNYRFSTLLAHITQHGGKIIELLYDEAYVIDSTHPFKGNINIEKLGGGHSNPRGGKRSLHPDGGFHQPDRRPTILLHPKPSGCTGYRR